MSPTPGEPATPATGEPETAAGAGATQADHALAALKQNPAELDAAIARGLAATAQGVPGVLEAWLPRLVSGEV
jgi:hypothetical protein